MNKTKRVLAIFLLCAGIVFSSKNATAQCNLSVTATQTADGPFKNDATFSISVTGAVGNVWATTYGPTGTHYGITSISNAKAGTYCVYAFDSFCDDTFCFNVVDTGTYNCNSLSGYISESDTCPLNDVNLSIYVSGGSGNYSYIWNTGSTNSFLQGKTSGYFKVIFTDNVSGCVDSAFKTVIDDTCNPCSNFYAYIYEQDGCGYNDVSLYVSSSPSLNSYLWNTGSASSSLSSRTSGNYNVIVTNSYGCIDTAYITVVDDTCNPCANFYANIYEQDGCGLNDITLNVYPKDSSTARYTYLWNNGSKNDTLMNRTSGNYYVIVTDTILNCVYTAFITVVDYTCNPCSNFQTDISESDYCSLNDVTLIAYPQSFGVPRYTYLWNNGSTKDTLYNKTSGSYYVIVTDTMLGCIDTAFITVVDDTCNPCANFYGYIYSYDSCQANDIQIYSYAYGGSGSYSYVWNTGATSSVLNNKPTGLYKVTVTDIVNGCVDTLSVFATDTVYRCCSANFEVNSLSMGATKIFSSYASSLSFSTITSYLWSFGDNTTGSGATATKTYGTTGNYTACHFIQDASGCKDTVCNTVSSPGPGRNLKVSHWGIQYIRDTNRFLYISYSNIGTTTEAGIVEYNYPAGMTLSSSSPAVTSSTGNKLVFNVGTLAPGAGGTIYLEMATPNTFILDSIKCDTARILPLASDIESWNNVSYNCQPVVGSYDPNDKMANPKGDGPDGNIDPATKEINYLVRFQNEGNWKTYKVRVEDTIDPSFDINSLKMGEASHPFRLVKSGRLLTFHFDNLQLTPKSENEEKSQGHLTYSLKLNSGLILGTQLKNTAYIYFDKNPAIITNTTKNTLKVEAGVRELRDDQDLDFTLVRVDERIIITSPKAMTSVKIYDVSGKLIISATPKAMNTEIDAKSLATDIYIVQVEMKDSQVMKKFRF
ncbi:MAG: DUF7619 domain-containing protein [Chitinophagales bacterium]